MPYKSLKQEHMFHYLESKGKISPKVVDEWDAASKGKTLPRKVKKMSSGGNVNLGAVLQAMYKKTHGGK